MRFDLDLSSDVLRRTPGTLFNLLGDLDEAWSRATEGPATFSPFDVVGHLIDGEETDWIPRARIILAGGPPPAFEPRNLEVLAPERGGLGPARGAP